MPDLKNERKAMRLVSGQKEFSDTPISYSHEFLQAYGVVHNKKTYYISLHESCRPFQQGSSCVNRKDSLLDQEEVSNLSVKKRP